MKNRYQKAFAKFEAKKRARLGDKAFLEKYIRSFKRSDKLLKVLLPILLILNPIVATGNLIVFFASYYKAYYLLMAVAWLFITIGWIFISISYYNVRFKFNKKKVDEWIQELQAIIANQPS